MFYIVSKNVGGRISDFYFHDWQNAKEECDRIAEDVKNHGAFSIRHIHYKLMPQNKLVYFYEGMTKENEKFEVSVTEGYFADDSLADDKVYELLKHHYNLFHASLLYKAIQDDSIRADLFIGGIEKIEKVVAEENCDHWEEYVPDELETLIE